MIPAYFILTTLWGILGYISNIYEPPKVKSDHQTGIFDGHDND